MAALACPTRNGMPIVDAANAKMPGRDSLIGPSYFLRSDLDPEWVELIWEHSVIPYLSEQLAGEEERLEEFAYARLKQSAAEEPAAGE